MNEEVWKPVPDFPSYFVSSLGRVIRSAPDSRNHTPRPLKPWVGNHGYETVGLVRDGKAHRQLIHRLVCAAFHGPAPSTAHQVAHSDGTRRNNCVNNLRWTTRAENMADCVLHGTLATGARHGRALKPERTPRGERHGHAQLTEADVLAIRCIKDMTGRAIANRYGVSPASVSLIRSHKTWSHI